MELTKKLKVVYEIDEAMMGSEYQCGIEGLKKMKEILERMEPEIEIVVITDSMNGANNTDVVISDSIWMDALEELDKNERTDLRFGRECFEHGDVYDEDEDHNCNNCRWISSCKDPNKYY